MRTASHRLHGASLARGLGWFSLGLGLAELLAPRHVARMVGGQGRHAGVVRSFGLREVAAGLMILLGRRPAAGVVSRVAGDLVDAAFVGKLVASPRARRGRALFGLASVLGATVLDVLAARRVLGPGTLRSARRLLSF